DIKPAPITSDMPVTAEVLQNAIQTDNSFPIDLPTAPAIPTVSAVPTVAAVYDRRIYAASDISANVASHYKTGGYRPPLQWGPPLQCGNGRQTDVLQADVPTETETPSPRGKTPEK